MNRLKIGDKYILENSAINPTPMTLVEITEKDYVFIDGASPWGGSKEDIHEMVKSGILKKVEGEDDE